MKLSLHNLVEIQLLKILIQVQNLRLKVIILFLYLLHCSAIILHNDVYDIYS